MRSLHWTLKNFLTILYRNSRRHTLRRSHEMLLDFIYLDLLREKSFENQLDIQRTDVMFRETSWNWVAKSLCREIEYLTRLSMFDTFKKSTEINEIESLSFFTSKIESLRWHFSLWITLFDFIVAARIVEKFEIEKSDTRENWSVLILIILYRQMHSLRFINMQTILKLYLYQDDARRRVLIILNQLNVVMRY
jgi:hypothetical protein